MQITGKSVHDFFDSESKKFLKQSANRSGSEWSEYEKTMEDILKTLTDSKNSSVKEKEKKEANKSTFNTYEHASGMESDYSEKENDSTSSNRVVNSSSSSPSTAVSASPISNTQKSKRTHCGSPKGVIDDPTYEFMKTQCEKDDLKDEERHKERLADKKAQREHEARMAELQSSTLKFMAGLLQGLFLTFILYILFSLFVTFLYLYLYVFLNTLII